MSSFNPLKHFRQPSMVPPAEAPRLNSDERLALLPQSHYAGIVRQTLPNGRPTLLARYDYTEIQGTREGAHATLHQVLLLSVKDLETVPGFEKTIHALNKSYRDNYLRVGPFSKHSRTGLKSAAMLAVPKASRMTPASMSPQTAPE